MRVPRLRFTVRRMMMAVVVVALIAGIVVETRQRQKRFAKLAFIHWSGALGGDNERKQNWHTYMWVKYTNAARYPWLPVTPDQPEPE